jgi:hypothetical protein
VVAGYLRLAYYRNVVLGKAGYLAGAAANTGAEVDVHGPMVALAVYLRHVLIIRIERLLVEMLGFLALVGNVLRKLFEFA